MKTYLRLCTMQLAALGLIVSTTLVLVMNCGVIYEEQKIELALLLLITLLLTAAPHAVVFLMVKNSILGTSVFAQVLSFMLSLIQFGITSTAYWNLAFGSHESSTEGLVLFILPVQFLALNACFIALGVLVKNIRSQNT